MNIYLFYVLEDLVNLYLYLPYNIIMMKIMQIFGITYLKIHILVKIQQKREVALEFYF